MGQAAAKHCRIVNYTGSIADLHGLWYVAGEYAGRLTLKSAGGLKLERVRPQSVTPVAVPRITHDRADWLRVLARRAGAYVPTAVRTWLIANELAAIEQTEYDTAPILRVTLLGWELAGALRGC